MANSFDPEKVNFADYLHVEGVEVLDPYLPAFKTDGVRTRNIKLIQAHLEKKAIQERLEGEKQKRTHLRKVEEENIEAQVADLPEWKKKLVKSKLKAKLEEDLPHPDTMTIEDLPPVEEEESPQTAPPPPQQKSPEEPKPIPAWKQRQLEREANNPSPPPSRPRYMPISNTAAEPVNFSPSPASPSVKRLPPKKVPSTSPVEHSLASEVPIVEDSANKTDPSYQMKEPKECYDMVNEPSRETDEVKSPADQSELQLEKQTPQDIPVAEKSPPVKKTVAKDSETTTTQEPITHKSNESPILADSEKQSLSTQQPISAESCNKESEQRDIEAAHIKSATPDQEYAKEDNTHPEEPTKVEDCMQEITQSAEVASQIDEELPKETITTNEEEQTEIETSSKENEKSTELASYTGEELSKKSSIKRDEQKENTHDESAKVENCIELAQQSGEAAAIEDQTSKEPIGGCESVHPKELTTIENISKETKPTAEDAAQEEITAASEKAKEEETVAPENPAEAKRSNEEAQQTTEAAIKEKMAEIKNVEHLSQQEPIAAENCGEEAKQTMETTDHIKGGTSMEGGKQEENIQNVSLQEPTKVEDSVKEAEQATETAPQIDEKTTKAAETRQPVSPPRSEAQQTEQNSTQAAFSEGQANASLSEMTATNDTILPEQNMKEQNSSKETVEQTEEANTSPTESALQNITDHEIVITTKSKGESEKTSQPSIEDNSVHPNDEKKPDIPNENTESAQQSQIPDIADVGSQEPPAALVKEMQAAAEQNQEVNKVEDAGTLEQTNSTGTSPSPECNGESSEPVNENNIRSDDQQKMEQESEQAFSSPPQSEPMSSPQNIVTPETSPATVPQVVPDANEPQPNGQTETITKPPSSM